MSSVYIFLSLWREIFSIIYKLNHSSRNKNKDMVSSERYLVVGIVVPSDWINQKIDESLKNSYKIKKEKYKNKNKFTQTEKEYIRDSDNRWDCAREFLEVKFEGLSLFWIYHDIVEQMIKDGLIQKENDYNLFLGMQVGKSGYELPSAFDLRKIEDKVFAKLSTLGLSLSAELKFVNLGNYCDCCG